MQNKRGYVKFGAIGIISAIVLIILVLFSQQTSAGTKADQYFIQNLTCENFTVD